MLIFKEIMAKNFPKLGRDLAIQVHEANRSPKISNQESSSPRHYKTVKVKHKSLEASRGKKKLLPCKGAPRRLSADFSAETLQTRTKWDDLFKVPKGKTCQPRKLPSKIVQD